MTTPNPYVQGTPLAFLWNHNYDLLGQINALQIQTSDLETRIFDIKQRINNLQSLATSYNQAIVQLNGTPPTFP